jgi:S1-C subfamily serine protease
MIEPLLLTTTRVRTFDGARALTEASGFFFAHDGRIFLVTSRHVVYEPAIGHRPDRIELNIHVDADDLTRVATLSVLLYDSGLANWRQARDSGGEVDVAAIELDVATLPAARQMRCFTAEHLVHDLHEVSVGDAALIVGFPLGFHDTVHHLPVVRQAVVASSFGVRFQGQGYFLTDARTHRGSSGAPVVMQAPGMVTELPWKLLGVHSARMDMSSRDLRLDESLGLNCAWYADILLTLIADRDPEPPAVD